MEPIWLLSACTLSLFHHSNKSILCLLRNAMTNTSTTLSHCCSNLRFRPRFCRDLESTESTRSSKLTSRLLAWRSRDCHPIILQVSDAAPGWRIKPCTDRLIWQVTTFNIPISPDWKFWSRVQLIYSFTSARRVALIVCFNFKLTDISAKINKNKSIK